MEITGEYRTFPCTFLVLSCIIFLHLFCGKIVGRNMEDHVNFLRTDKHKASSNLIIVY